MSQANMLRPVSNKVRREPSAGHQTIIRHREGAAVDSLQEKVFTNWANFILRTKGYSIQSVTRDLGDGLMLLQLATALTEKPLPAFNKRPIQQAQKLENVQIALNLIKSDGLNINVDTKGVVEGDSKTILGLFWLMIKQYQLGSAVNTNFGSSHDKESDLKQLDAELERLSQKNANFEKIGSQISGGPVPPTTQAADCLKCSKALSEGDALSVDGVTKYHHGCFVCTTCKKPFEEAYYYSHNNEPYCLDHFLKVAGKKCATCNEYIKDDITTANNLFYHTNCFVCHTCKNPFANDYTVYQGKHYCKQDYYRIRGWLCARCDEVIGKNDKKSMGKVWHTKCFNCTKCSKSFGSDGFYEFHGQPYCPSCHGSMSKEK